MATIKNYDRSLAMTGDKNPMKQKAAREKSSKSHKGQIAWNKVLTKEQMSLHYKNGMKGGRLKGYKHTLASRKKMSDNTIGKKHNVILSVERRIFLSEQMKKNRLDFEFNKKMFTALCKSITKPHRKVKEWIKEYTELKTVSNFCFSVGSRYGSIDEAEPNRKIAIFIDGNYWHNYPNLNKWDKCCNTVLEKQGWNVLRFWESDINNNQERVIQKLINVGLV